MNSQKLIKEREKNECGCKTSEKKTKNAEMND